MNRTKICLRLLVILVLMGNVTGCNSPYSTEQQRQTAIEQASAIFASDAINIDMIADPQLNAFNRVPNSCTVLIIQAERRDQLEGLLNNPALLRNLFARAGGSENILKLDSYVMMPGQRVTLHLDRVEQARYVALIAGYYPQPNERHVRIFSIPLELSSQGWWNKRWQAHFIPINIEITLGETTIVRSNKSIRRPSDDVVFPSKSATGKASKSIMR